jgi:hypothetical protein
LNLKLKPTCAYFCAGSNVEAAEEGGGKDAEGKEQEQEEEEEEEEESEGEEGKEGDKEAKKDKKKKDKEDNKEDKKEDKKDKELSGVALMLSQFHSSPAGSNYKAVKEKVKGHINGLPC